VFYNSSYSKNSELNPLGEYRFLSVFHASRGIIIFLIYNKGLSAKASYIKAKALLELTSRAYFSPIVVAVLEGGLIIIKLPRFFSIRIALILRLYSS